MTADFMEAIWNTYEDSIDETTAGRIFDRWINFVPPNAVRVRLTLRETVCERLTAFITVLRALKYHPRFNWTAIVNTFPDEWSNFITAAALVGNNYYYGYKKDLGVVDSSRYCNLGLVAKELMVKASGDIALNKGGLFAGRSAHRATIRTMVTNYKTARSNDTTPAGTGSYLAVNDQYSDIVENCTFAL